MKKIPVIQHQILFDNVAIDEYGRMQEEAIPSEFSGFIPLEGEFLFNKISNSKVLVYKGNKYPILTNIQYYEGNYEGDVLVRCNFSFKAGQEYEISVQTPSNGCPICLSLYFQNYCKGESQEQRYCDGGIITWTIVPEISFSLFDQYSELIVINSDMGSAWNTTLNNLTITPSQIRINGLYPISTAIEAGEGIICNEDKQISSKLTWTELT